MPGAGERPGRSAAGTASSSLTVPLTVPLPGAVRSSYRREDVEFVIADLGDEPLEAPLAEREQRLRAGGHYSERLPIEYVPSARYLALFDRLLATTAPGVARAAAVTAERILARHQARNLDRDLVLVSLARAGTPFGVLLVRWWRRHGLAVPHYTLSIIRGRGIDGLAIAHIRSHHPGAALQFVDGWTGKGAIGVELASSCAGPGPAHGLDPTLAVMADPAHVTGLFGTREDLLLPSACLNATVSGLVSRTVLRPDLTGGFHGAKYYGQLQADDVSGRFIDAIEAEFPARDEVQAEAALIGPDASPPLGAGAACARQIAADYGIADLNLVKPGIGETLRVLLRRDPWLVLVRDAGDATLEPILELAAEKDIPVRVHGAMTYRACGLIKGD